MHQLHQWILNDMNIQNASRASIEHWQINQFKAQLHYAKENSSFYANTFSAAAINSIQTFDDISHLPLITSKQVSEFGQNMLCVSLGDIQRIRTLPTSGTLGIPKRIYFTANDLQRTVDFFSIGMLPFVRKDRNVAIMIGNSREHSIADLLQKGLQKSGIVASIFSYNIAFDTLCSSLLKQKPYCIIGIPAQIFYLCRMLPDLKPSIVLLSADYISPSLITTIEREWQCDVVTHYGLTESAYGCAVQGLDKCFQSIRSSEFLLEIIDPRTDQRLPEGIEGEIVISTLRSEAMPLIRYRIGDIASLHWLNISKDIYLPMLGEVRGRYINQCQSVNIHQLDDLLYQLPLIRSYQAYWKNGDLILAIDGEIPIVTDAWQNINANIYFEKREFNPFSVCQKQMIHQKEYYDK